MTRSRWGVLFVSLLVSCAMAPRDVRAQCFSDGCGGTWGGGPTTYILSGGPSPSEQLLADDQMNICINGTRLFCDSNILSDYYNAIQFKATPGDTIRITSYDYFGRCRSRTALWLHNGKGASQKLADGRNDGCNNWPVRTLFDDVSFTLPAWPSDGLTATLTADPTSVGVGDDITITMTIKNESGEEVTGVTPGASLTIAGDAAATLLSGPEPAASVTLADGASTEFKFKYTADKKGTLTFSGAASGTRASGDSAGSPTVSTPTITVVDAFKLSSVLMTRGSTAHLHPAHLVVLLPTITKQSVQPIDPGTFKFTLSPDEGLIRTKETADGTPPDGSGDFVVTLFGRVEDERNQDVFDKLISTNTPMPLTDGLTAKMTWTRNGKSYSLEAKGTPKDENNGEWVIEYPDWSVVTGEPPLITVLENEQAEERQFYAVGNKITEFTKSHPDYRQAPLVRKWCLRATRRDDDGNGPTTPKDAGENISYFLGTRISARWQGERLSIPELVAVFENKGTPPAYPCIGFATTITGFARVVGIRAREIDNALKYVNLFNDPWWAQHGTSELWYDGAWHWFDLFFAPKNGGQAIREDQYPDFYLNSRYIYYRYRVIRSYAAVSEAFLSDFALLKDGVDGQPANFSTPVSQWRSYKSAVDGKVFAHINTYSPVTTLFTDAQGRRLGAAGPVTEDDYYTKDKLLPLTGGNSFWEVPDAYYIAPGTPASTNTLDPAATYALKEALVIPLESFNDQCTIKVTGTGDGPYEVKVWVDGADGPVDLYSFSGNITTGEEVVKTLSIDRSSEIPVVTETAAPTDSGQGIPAVTNGCGAGVCGAGTTAMAPVMLLGFWGMKRGNRRR